LSTGFLWSLPSVSHRRQQHLIGFEENVETAFNADGATSFARGFSGIYFLAATAASAAMAAPKESL
jgi:hypothetical protein